MITLLLIAALITLGLGATAGEPSSIKATGIILGIILLMLHPLAALAIVLSLGVIATPIVIAYKLIK